VCAATTKGSPADFQIRLAPNLPLQRHANVELLQRRHFRNNRPPPPRRLAAYDAASSAAALLPRADSPRELFVGAGSRRRVAHTDPRATHICAANASLCGAGYPIFTASITLPSPPAHIRQRPPRLPSPAAHRPNRREKLALAFFEQFRVDVQKPRHSHRRKQQIPISSSIRGPDSRAPSASRNSARSSAISPARPSALPIKTQSARPPRQ